LSSGLGPATMSLIGQFPWDPFPPGLPEPRGPDPIQSSAYRGAVTGSDAYRSTRLALRVEGDTLRIGNRFVPIGRYRQVSFLALGNAANAQTLAALHTFRDRLTQGLIVGPIEPGPELPFRSVELSPGWPDRAEAEGVVRAAQEMGSELSEEDLFLLLVSPGALLGLCLPPPSLGASAWRDFLISVSDQGASGRELALLVRLLGAGGVGGRLAAISPRAEVVSFVIDRGDGPALLGGGPLYPPSREERVQGRAILDRLGLTSHAPTAALATLVPDSSLPAGAPGNVRRPVLVTSAPDALGGAGDSLFDRKWASRMGMLSLHGPPESAADQFVRRVEEVIDGERPDPQAHWKGLAVLAATTLESLEGSDEGPLLGRFLTRAQAEIRRRELSIGLMRTSGGVGDPRYPPGAVVGAPTREDFAVAPGRARALRMEPAITDVGLIAVAAFPQTPTRS
jgi:Domain of unknown function (DUF4147)